MAGQIVHASVGTQCSQAEWESSATHIISGSAGVWVLTSGDIDNTAYGASWSGQYVTAPSKAAVYNQMQLLTAVSGSTANSGAVAALQAISGAVIASITAIQNVSGISPVSGAVAALKAVSGSVATHAAIHQAGQASAINVSGLTGLLVTPQTPAAHNHIINTVLANGSWDGDTVSGVVAQLVSATQIVYQKSSGYWDLADADAEVTAAGTLLMATATIASAAGGVLLKKGLIRNDSGFGASLAIGASGVYFLGTAAGGILPKASAPSGPGDIVRTVGEGWCADVPRLLWFEPNPSWYEHS